jgi:hypothetical protein
MNVREENRSTLTEPVRNLGRVKISQVVLHLDLSSELSDNYIAHEAIKAIDIVEARSRSYRINPEEVRTWIRENLAILRSHPVLRGSFKGEIYGEKGTDKQVTKLAIKGNYKALKGEECCQVIIAAHRCSRMSSRTNWQWRSTQWTYNTYDSVKSVEGYGELSDWRNSDGTWKFGDPESYQFNYKRDRLSKSGSLKYFAGEFEKTRAKRAAKSLIENGLRVAWQRGGLGTSGPVEFTRDGYGVASGAASLRGFKSLLEDTSYIRGMFLDLDSTPTGDHLTEEDREAIEVRFANVLDEVSGPEEETTGPSAEDLVAKALIHLRFSNLEI